MTHYTGFSKRVSSLSAWYVGSIYLLGNLRISISCQYISNQGEKIECYMKRGNNLGGTLRMKNFITIFIKCLNHASETKLKGNNQFKAPFLTYKEINCDVKLLSLLLLVYLQNQYVHVRLEHCEDRAKSAVSSLSPSAVFTIVNSLIAYDLTENQNNISVRIFIFQ